MNDRTSVAICNRSSPLPTQRSESVGVREAKPRRIVQNLRCPAIALVKDTLRILGNPTVASSEHSLLPLLVAVTIAWVAACSSGKQPDATGSPPGRGVYVPLSWHVARNSPGHRVHVV